MKSKIPRLKLLPKGQYKGVNEDDPIRYYYWPVVGPLYRRRIELCLAECRGGERVLEIGFGSGVSFLNLNDMYAEIHGLDLTAEAAAVQGVFATLGVKAYLRQGNVLAMPYREGYFDTVLLISILEHLKPEEQEPAFREIRRVLRPGGQVVYGVPVERPFMVFMFRLLGYDIRRAHFSTERQIAEAAGKVLRKERIVQMKATLPILGAVYEVGNFTKPDLE